MGRKSTSSAKSIYKQVRIQYHNPYESPINPLLEQVNLTQSLRVPTSKIHGIKLDKLRQKANLEKLKSDKRQRHFRLKNKQNTNTQITQQLKLVRSQSAFLKNMMARKIHDLRIEKHFNNKKQDIEHFKYKMGLLSRFNEERKYQEWMAKSVKAHQQKAQLRQSSYKAKKNLQQRRFKSMKIRKASKRRNYNSIFNQQEEHRNHIMQRKLHSQMRIEMSNLNKMQHNIDKTNKMRRFINQEYKYIISTVKRKEEKIRNELLQQKQLSQGIALVDNQLTKARNEGGRGEYGLGGSMNSSAQSSLKVSQKASRLKGYKKSKKRKKQNSSKVSEKIRKVDNMDKENRTNGEETNSKGSDEDSQGQNSQKSFKFDSVSSRKSEEKTQDYLIDFKHESPQKEADQPTERSSETKSYNLQPMELLPLSTTQDEKEPAHTNIDIEIQSNALKSENRTENNPQSSNYTTTPEQDSYIDDQDLNDIYDWSEFSENLVYGGGK